jgi:hypothetical protein
MRKSDLFFLLVGIGFAAMVFFLGVHPQLSDDSYKAGLSVRQTLVRDLGITDLCLFTEARYTRHITQADLHSAFQDHPMALDHFPSGSMVNPPDGIQRVSP